MELDNVMLDSKSVREGVWAAYDGDFELLIGSASTPEYEDAQSKAMQPYLMLSREGSLTPEVEQKLEAGLLVDTCLHDWRGLTSGGVPVPFSKAKAKELLTHPGGYRLFKFVRTIAYGSSRFRAAALEQAKGN